jgi:hypothetical protein
MNMKQILILVMMVMILKNLGEYSNFLDNINPDQLIEIVDNPDGTYTAYYNKEDGNDDDGQEDEDNNR